MKRRHLQRRTEAMNQLTKLGIASLLLLTACSARPERFEEDPVEQTPTETQSEPREEPIDPLPLRDGEPAVEMLGEQDVTREFMVGDLRVIHKSTPNNPVVTARLYRVGGSAALSASEAGIEKLSYTVAATGGTESTPKDAFNDALDSTGSSVYSFAGRDWSGYGMKTLVDHYDDTWELFTQVVMEPAMPRDEIELARTRQLAELRSLLENPDTHVSYVASQRMFDGHPYKTLQLGTEENVKSFTRRELRQYQRDQLDPSQMLLVVVGHIPTDKVAARVQSSLGRLEGSGNELEPLPEFTSEPGVEIVDRDLPTNYVLGYFDAPAPGAADYPALLVALEYLRDKLFEEIRTKRKLTYAVSAGLGSRRANYGFLYVTAVDPQTTLDVMFAQVEELKLITLPKSVVEETVNVFITDHYMGLETNGAQADMLAEAQLVEGDWKRADRFLERVRAVTPDQIQDAAQTYLKGYRFGVVGRAANLQEAYFQPAASGPKVDANR